MSIQIIRAIDSSHHPEVGVYIPTEAQPIPSFVTLTLFHQGRGKNTERKGFIIARKFVATGILRW